MTSAYPAVVGDASTSMQGVLTLQAVQGMPINTNLADAAFVLLQLPPHPTLRSMWGVESAVETCCRRCQSGAAGCRSSVSAKKRWNVRPDHRSLCPYLTVHPPHHILACPVSYIQRPLIC